MKLYSIFSMAILTLFIFSSCGNSGGSSGASANLTGYKTESLGGSAELAIKKDGAGNLAETGYTANGKKNGAWMTYHPEEGNRIKTLSSYTDGQLNGPHLEFSTRGQIEKKIEYKAGKYHGTFATYKFGRPEKISNYVNGELDGKYEEYNSAGKLMKEVNFKNGKQDGKLKYFDEEGNVTLEYEYKNGEKVSGGIIDK